MQAEVVKGDSSNMSDNDEVFSASAGAVTNCERTIEFSFLHILPPELYSSMVVQQLHTY